MRSLPEVRAPDRGLGVDLGLIMTFKCLKPREDAGYPAPRVGGGGWGMGSVSKESACETWVQPLDWEDALEEGMVTHCSILA